METVSYVKTNQKTIKTMSLKGMITDSQHFDNDVFLAFLERLVQKNESKLISKLVETSPSLKLGSVLITLGWTAIDANDELYMWQTLLHAIRLDSNSKLITALTHVTKEKWKTTTYTSRWNHLQILNYFFWHRKQRGVAVMWDSALSTLAPIQESWSEG